MQKGGVMLNYYNGSLKSALIDVYPDLGLRKDGFGSGDRANKSKNPWFNVLFRGETQAVEGGNKTT